MCVERRRINRPHSPHICLKYVLARLMTMTMTMASTASSSNISSSSNSEANNCLSINSQFYAQSIAIIPVSSRPTSQLASQMPDRRRFERVYVCLCMITTTLTFTVMCVMHFRSHVTAFNEPSMSPIVEHHIAYIHRPDVPFSECMIYK